MGFCIGFKRKQDMEVHIKRVHDENKDFICDKCGRGYAKRYDLRIHTDKSVCETRKPYMDKLEEAYRRCEMMNAGGQLL